MKARWILVFGALVFGCTDRVNTDAPGAQAAANGRRDNVVGSAAPICASATQAYVASEATGWWRQKIDPTRSNDGPYAYAYAKPDAGILQTAAGLRERGVELRQDVGAHRWENLGDRARLTVEGLLAGEPGYLATFELAVKDDALIIERFSVLRGATRYVCNEERLVAEK